MVEGDCSGADETSASESCESLRLLQVPDRPQTDPGEEGGKGRCVGRW